MPFLFLFTYTNVAFFLPEENIHYFSKKKEKKDRSQEPGQKISPFHSWKVCIICYLLMCGGLHNSWTHTCTWGFYLHVWGEFPDQEKGVHGCCLPCAFDSAHTQACVYWYNSGFFLKLVPLLSIDESTPVIECHHQRGKARGSLNNHSAAVKLPWLQLFVQRT